MFDVSITTIDYKSITMKDVRNISLTSGRLILVDKNGERDMFNTGMIDCLYMFNTTYCYQDQIIEGVPAE